MVRSFVWRSVLILPVILGLSLSGVVFHATRAMAAGTCDPLTPHNFDGAGGYPAIQGGYGAEAYINVRDAAFCTQNTTDPNHISAWVMIAGYYSCELAQAGYRKTKDITYWLDFAEYSDCYGNYNETSFGTTGLSNGTNHHYQVYYDTSVTPHVERMDISAGTYKLATNFDPVGDWGHPFTPFWMGEVFDSGDEMPGTSTQETSFTSVQFQAHTALTWSTPGVTEWTKSNQQGCFGWGNTPDFNIRHGSDC